MSMLDPYEAARIERSRRRAIRLLSIVLLLASGFCFYLFVGILNPRGQTRAIGTLNEYAVGVTTQRAVRKLSASDTIMNRPEVSEDPIFVTRRADGTWRAILAWDSQSGCLVEPQAEVFVDACSGNVYDANGYSIGANTRLRLGSLPVEVGEDGSVVIRDQLLRDERF
ncbi:MAG TPA: hypothetical protein VGE07_06660 [Herpetosiphonaceae bacterium]